MKSFLRNIVPGILLTAFVCVTLAGCHHSSHNKESHKKAKNGPGTETPAY